MHPTPSPDDVVAVQEIRGVHDAWIAAELAGDTEAVLRLCTDDVRWLTPNSGELLGPAAVRRFLSSGADCPDGIRATNIRIEVSGALACKTSRFETRLRVSESGQVRFVRGVHVWILRRVQGAWRVALVTWQTDT
jgi:ketosteroid isomerase-like protein